MSFTEFCLVVGLIVLVLGIIHIYQVRTIPRNQYLKTVLEYPTYAGQEWMNEILVRAEVSRVLGRQVSVNHNAFNLKHLVQEGLLEDKLSTTWFQGEHEVPCYFFKPTEQGLRRLERQPA